MVTWFAILSCEATSLIFTSTLESGSGNLVCDSQLQKVVLTCFRTFAGAHFDFSKQKSFLGLFLPVFCTNLAKTCGQSQYQQITPFSGHFASCKPFQAIVSGI